MNPKHNYLSNLFQDPSISNRQGRKIIKTPEKSVWKGMQLITEGSPRKSISPCSQRKIENAKSSLNFNYLIADRSQSPILENNKKSNTNLTGRKFLNNLETNTVNYNQPVKRAFKPILEAGKIKDFNLLSL